MDTIEPQVPPPTVQAQHHVKTVSDVMGHILFQLHTYTKPLDGLSVGSRTSKAHALVKDLMRLVNDIKIQLLMLDFMVEPENFNPRAMLIQAIQLSLIHI